MEYADYSFYTTEYLKGKESAIDPASFPYYADKATMMIQQRTMGKSDQLKDHERVKKCMCAIAETIKAEENETRMKSESVGQRSATFELKTTADYKQEREQIYMQYLLTLNLLNRRVAVL